jgi:hypothetical protein
MAFSRFPILKRVARFSTTTTLARLGLTCRSLRNEIFNADNKIKTDLRKRTRCDGVGMLIRSIFHQRPPADHPQGPFSNVAKCGADDPTALERECDSCGLMTCNRCRIHVFYQDTHAPMNTNRPEIWDIFALTYGGMPFLILNSATVGPRKR